MPDATRREIGEFRSSDIDAAAKALTAKLTANRSDSHRSRATPVNGYRSFTCAVDGDGRCRTLGEELEVRRSLVWALASPAAIAVLCRWPRGRPSGALGNGAAGSGDTPRHRHAAGLHPAIAAYAGPSTLMVDSPWPARTTTMSAGSAEGLLSRCTAPLGT